MNRILQAEVILTLTREQASRILACLNYASRKCPDPKHRELEGVVREQCAKQGVQQ